jgi:TPR repeat protein/regulator of protease activity HflC (stomatin/prohibitin superfamily)
MVALQSDDSREANMVQTAGPKRRACQVWETAEIRAMLGDDWFARCIEFVEDPEQAASLSNEQLQAVHRVLGFAYLTGAGGEWDEATAEKHLHAAVIAGDTDAKAMLGAVLLGRENERDKQRGYVLTTEAANAGSASAQFHLSGVFEEGRLVKEDKNESRRLLVAAAGAGYAQAQYTLGCKLLAEHHDKQEEARSWLEKACDQHYPPALSKLGFLYMLERGKDSQEKSNALIQRAADAGEVRGQWMIGCNYESGRFGFTKDLAQAADWFERGSNLPKGTFGRHFCLDDLGDAYLYGTGRARDPQRAIELFKEAAEEGSPKAAFTLYEYCRDGTHLGKDIGEAIRWCRKAAENGHDRAVQLFDVGEFGDKTPPDVTREVSFQWLLHAANQSVTSSTHYRLGLRYWNGDGIDKDESAAVAWFSFAASVESSDASAEAAYALGAAYENGRGVRRRDTASASRWYRRAVELGMSAANADLTRIAKADAKMTNNDLVSEPTPAQQRGIMNEPRGVGSSDTLFWFLCASFAAVFLLVQGWPLAILGVALAIWILSGFRRVPLGHAGVPLVFGARKGSWVLSEGLQWILAGVMGHINVDIRIKSTTVPSIQAITKDGVPLRPTAVMSYRVAAPALYLSAGTNIESIGLPEAVGRSIIAFIKNRSIGEALAAQGDDLPTVRTAVSNTIAQWGLRLDSIQVTNITPPPEIIAEMQRKYQTEQVVEQTELIKKAMNLSSQQAAEFGQVERQKVRKQINEVRLSGDEGLVKLLESMFKRQQ